jgi:hypothetical protein
METPASDARTLNNEHTIDVVEARAEFSQLERSLSRYQHSTVSKSPTDPEKGDDSAEQPFNLREYLASSNDANHVAGINHKHVSVTWEDLEVIGAGGVNMKFYIRTFPGTSLCSYNSIDSFSELLDAIISSLMFPLMITWNLLTPVLPKRFKTFETKTIIHK